MPFWKRPRKRPENEPEVQMQEQRKGSAFGLLSDVGQVRTSNQDHAFALLTSLPSLSGQLSLGLFIVADGMGGHVGGGTASARAVEVVAIQVLQDLVLRILREEPPEAIQDMLRTAIVETNRRIYEEATRQGNDMGTTVTAMLVLGERCYVAHVGDSRLYTYDGNALQRRTRDHSMVARLLELGQITAEEARHHPKRNYLYQSVGQQELIEAEISSFALDDCSHLLLCSDGLWGSVEEEDLARILAEGGDPQEICARLVAQANMAGGEDNITVILVALPMRPAKPDEGASEQ